MGIVNNEWIFILGWTTLLRHVQTVCIPQHICLGSYKAFQETEWRLWWICCFMYWLHKVCLLWQMCRTYWHGKAWPSENTMDSFDRAGCCWAKQACRLARRQVQGDIRRGAGVPCCVIPLKAWWRWKSSCSGGLDDRRRSVIRDSRLQLHRRKGVPASAGEKCKYNLVETTTPEWLHFHHQLIFSSLSVNDTHLC